MLPVTDSEPLIVTLPDIVPPEELNLVFELLKEACAKVVAIFAWL